MTTPIPGSIRDRLTRLEERVTALELTHGVDAATLIDHDKRLDHIEEHSQPVCQPSTKRTPQIID